MKQMIFKTKEGEFDFTNKKVRLNGKVLDKFSLCASMERLDFKRFQFATLYTYDVCNYETIKGELYDYLTENEVTETETTTNESDEVAETANGGEVANESVESAEVAETETTTTKSVWDEVSLSLNGFELLAIQSYLRYAKQYYNSEYDKEKIDTILSKCEMLENEYKTTTNESVESTEVANEGEGDDPHTETANGGEVANESVESAEVAETTTHTNDEVRDEYQTLYNEFKEKWHIFPFGGVGTYYFYCSSGELCLGIRKSDKRQYNGYRLVEIFATYNPNEMREYLQNNNPIK